MDPETIAKSLLEDVDLPEALQNDFRLLLKFAFQALSARSAGSLIDVINRISEISRENVRSPSKGFSELEALILKLGRNARSDLISAYNLIFHLLNAAEKLHICRINREREKTQSRQHTIRQAVEKIAKRETDFINQLYDLSIIPTITAHPTEARRLSVLHKLDEISKNLAAYNSKDLTAREGRHFEKKVLRSVILLAATNSLRETKPDVIQEVYLALHYLSKTIWEIVPELYQDLLSALPEDVQVDLFRIKMLSFRSWIGGDRDGNPKVTSQVTKETLKILRGKALKLHRHEVSRLRRDLTISTKKAQVSRELLESIAKDCQALKYEIPAYMASEPYRIKFELMLKKLDLAAVDPAAYSPDEYLEDLRLAEKSLKENGFKEIAKDSTLFRLIVRAKTFGFHFATLDIRQHSQAHENAVAEIFEKSGGENYKALPEEGRLRALEAALGVDKNILKPLSEYTSETAELINLFQLIAEEKRVIPDAITSYIISMTHDTSDMLEVLFLMQQCGLRKKTKNGWHSELHIVPLFETIDDLERSKTLFEEFLANAVYREHLESMGNFQEIMLGYSDSNKDGGFLISNLLLHRSCLKLVYTAEKHGIKLGLFHGRGGTIARGGGRSVNAIRASSGSQSRGYIRFTEQGEVISFRYGLAALAHRHLEQIINAMLTESAKKQERLAPEANEEIKRLGALSFKKYRSLIDHPAFWEWYVKTTPVEFISKLPIASRPVSRSTKEVTFEGLRAIPWGFAWNQSRFMAPSWYGVGSALENADFDKLKKDYSDDPLFKIILDSLELELARSRPEIGERYARSSDPEITAVVLEEHKRTKEAVLKIKGQRELLENRQLIKNLITLRNRHLDAVHLTQKIMIEDLYAEKDTDTKTMLEKMILESINTIAAALQTTG